MIYWEKATIIKVIEEHPGFQEMEVEMNNGERETAINYTHLTGKVQEGNQVILNTTAVQLGLGTGGKHYVAHIIGTYGKVGEDQQGHIVKMRYTPYQFAVLSGEEGESPFHSCFIEDKTFITSGKWRQILINTPVMITELHSMLPILITYLKQMSDKNLRIVYLMTDGAALPVYLSKHVSKLKHLKWLNHTITIGQSFGGDMETVNKYSALQAAKKVFNADIIITGMGPGVVGTGTPLGFSGMEQGEMVNCVNQLGGLPIFVPRISLADKRERHFGISHHSLTALKIAAVTKAVVPYPLGYDRIKKQIININNHFCIGNKPMDPVVLEKLISFYPEQITTMGRTINDDPVFFQSVALAADLAIHLIKCSKKEKNDWPKNGKHVDLERFLRSWGA